MKVSEGALDAILYFAKGNVAEAVQALQFVSLKTKDTEITEDAVYEATLSIRAEIFDNLLRAAFEGNFSQGRQFIDEMIIEKGFSGIEILAGLSEALVDSGESDLDIARLIVKVAETDFHLKDANSDRIQLEKLLSTFS